MKEFFPRELWPVIDPDYRKDKDEDGAGRNTAKGKSLQIPGYEKAAELSALDTELDDDKGGEGLLRNEEDEDMVEEEVDEEFDEEEEGGDYNAEQYFDDGGDDGGDEYDAG